MTKAEVHKQYVTIAQAFIDELPAEYIDHFIQDEDYVFPYIKPIEKMNALFGGTVISANRMLEIENASIELMNRYHTARIREQLIKLKSE
jgi:hypothetical protein